MQTIDRRSTVKTLERKPSVNKSQMIEEMQRVLGSRKDAQTALDSILDTIGASLRKGESVTLSGFGTFKVQKKNGRTGRNPRTGETIQIEEKIIPRFVPGKKLKEAVNS
jgi:DNA-binding protein HU-beta